MRLYYFTGTGNSLWVARLLAEQLGGADLVPIPRALKSGHAPRAAGRTGVVFPVYFFGLPLIVERFIRERLPIAGYTFAVATCGGWPGGALLQAAQLVSRRGGRLSAGFAVTMPGNYTALYSPWPPEKQQAAFERARADVQRIADVVRRGELGRIEASPLVLRAPLGVLYRRHFVPRCHGMDRRFAADERCNGCGVCTQVCPVANVELRGSRPAWLGRCEQCFACFHWCPEQAIQAGKRTAKRSRYHQPEVTLTDMTFSATRRG